MSFINGIRTKRTISKKTSTSGVDFSVIGLVGTAPIFDVKAENQTVNKPVLITRNDNAVAYFGNNRSEYTIPAALEAIFARLDSCKVVVINVFDPSKHKTTKTAESKKIDDDGTLNLPAGFYDLSVKKGSTNMVEDTDYTVTDAGIKVKGSNLHAGDTVTLTFTYPDVSKIAVSDIVGGVDTDGNRTGIEAFKNSLSECGIKPRIIIAPQYSSSLTVGNAIDDLCQKFRAHGYVTVPETTSISEAITSRGETSTNSFKIHSKKVECVYEWVKTYNTFEDKYEYRPADAYLAATRVYTDTTYGMHYSTGNQLVKGIEGVKTPVYFDIQDENSDSNLLNAQGITTIIYDDGYRFWGNRNSSFPANENIDSFVNEERIADYIDESIAIGSRQFMSGPIDTPMVDSIVNYGLQFLAGLKRGGWIVDGDCWYNPAKNTYDELAKGHLIISRKFVSPTPLEELEYESDIDIELLSEVGQEN